jgi:uncharacterized protein (DUF983 family)
MRTVIRSVPVAKMLQTFTEMEPTLETLQRSLPHCGAVNLFPGFSQILAFTCKECGAGARLSDDVDGRRQRWIL